MTGGLGNDLDVRRVGSDQVGIRPDREPQQLRDQPRVVFRQRTQRLVEYPARIGWAAAPQHRVGPRCRQLPDDLVVPEPAVLGEHVERGQPVVDRTTHHCKLGTVQAKHRIDPGRWLLLERFVDERCCLGQPTELHQFMRSIHPEQPTVAR